jgi:anthranilate synthase component 1
MHLVSNVRGRLGAAHDAFAAFRATFPAGTLTGAPKVRAMQIIDELEPVRRGLYGGAVGYFAFGGAMDTAIAIHSVLMRTAVRTSRRVPASSRTPIPSPSIANA